MNVNFATSQLFIDLILPEWTYDFMITELSKDPFYR